MATDVLSLSWLSQYWYIPWVSAVVYVVLVHTGKNWLSEKTPFNIPRVVMIAWNVVMSIITIALFWKVGALGVAGQVLTEGLEAVSCRTISSDNQELLSWVVLFAIVKVVELGDTALIVLRKTPLNFLHWYYHVTYMVYGWYAVSHGSGSAMIMIALNTTMHSIVYCYYTAFIIAKHFNCSLPPKFSMVITALQILQNVAGVAFNIVALLALLRGADCHFTYVEFVLGMINYSTCGALFCNFFYQRYIVTKPKEKSR